MLGSKEYIRDWKRWSLLTRLRAFQVRTDVVASQSGEVPAESWSDTSVSVEGGSGSAVAETIVLSEV